MNFEEENQLIVVHTIEDKKNKNQNKFHAHFHRTKLQL